MICRVGPINIIGNVKQLEAANIHSYIHTYIHIMIHTRTFICTYMHTYLHVYTYIHTHIHTHMHTYTHAYINTYTHALAALWFDEVIADLLDAHAPMTEITCRVRSSSDRWYNSECCSAKRHARQKDPFDGGS